MLYLNFWNTPRRLISRPGIWRPKIGAQAPGWAGDPANNRPGGFKRFDRWQKLPLKAWKLYWRTQKQGARMASVYGFTTPASEVDYCIADGRVRLFELRGDVLFDERSGIAVDGWEDRLVDFVVKYSLHKDIDGTGLPSFVHGLIERGLIAEA